MSDVGLHAEWLSLLEVSGPFLAESVLKEAFPQGLEGLDASKKKLVRQAYDEWRDALDLGDALLPKIHRAWIELILGQVLEFDENGSGDILKATVAETLRCDLPGHGVTLRPNYAVTDGRENGSPLLLISVYDPETPMDKALRTNGWAANPADRMVELCRATGVRLGLVTNGEQWMFVDAPVGAVTTFASWYARLWAQEPITLQAFINLLGIRRFFVDRSQQLPALLDNSLKHQDEVTDALGEQVRRAVEVLIQALDRADVDRDRKLLEGIEPSELYEAGLTVMMRIVFLLSAEERGLLLMGDERYEANYAISTLRTQLRAETEEILERRKDAWSRLLATFRAVYGGIEHEIMRLPALGGSLFDPDRFPFLEGRAKGTNWRSTAAEPLPIDNRTVLYLLDAVQLFQGRTISYQALDVEQIGYVYEGLLERTVVRANDVTLDLDATKNAKKPWLTLPELDDAVANGRNAVEELLKERTASSASRVRNDLDKPVDEDAADKLLTACHADRSLRDRIRPYFHLLRTDRWGYPLVYPKGTFIVTTGADRRETGTHYTPKSFTEAIVKETLEPIVYAGPAEGKPREEWKLKFPAEILDLKICDPAMGSGAFLVQVCRWLSERLVEAWAQVEEHGKGVTADGEVVEEIGSLEPLRKDAEERLLIAKRLIAERCLYGVDLNPLAVELAKLSIWLVTLAKGRPFGFLDHNLRCGDSLLGIVSLEQLHYLEMNPGKGSSKKLFASKIDESIRRAIELRTELRHRPIFDIRDVEEMACLDALAHRQLALPELIADALIGAVIAADGSDIDTTTLSIESGGALAGDEGKTTVLSRRAAAELAVDLPRGKQSRHPLHWPLEFPEVFNRDNKGFDAIVGNPPFMGGRLIGRRLGNAYQEYLKIVRNHVVGSPDLCVYFFLRGFQLIRDRAHFGMLSTKSIAETGSRVVGLDQIIGGGGTLRRANARVPWPGHAAVVVSVIWITKGHWTGAVVLNNRSVSSITGALEEEFEIERPRKLKALKGKFSQGQDIMGRGFELNAEERASIIAEDPRSGDVIFPLFNGQDLNGLPELMPYRWVIYFRDWTEEKSSKYEAAFRRVVTVVKPYRESLTGQIHQKCYWKFWDLRPILMQELAKRTWMLASAINTKYVTFRRVPTTAVYNKKTKLYFLYEWWQFACLQSSLHQEWSFWLCGTLGASTLNYSTSVALETWPMPSLDNPRTKEHLNILGELYHEARNSIQSLDRIGLTQLYNRFHDVAECDPRIEDLRRMHREIDSAVTGAYGWDDIELGHDFQTVDYLPVNDQVRFTLAKEAKIEVLRRLASLNRVRFDEEHASAKKGLVRKSSGEGEVPDYDLFAVRGGKA